MNSGMTTAQLKERLIDQNTEEDLEAGDTQANQALMSMTDPKVAGWDLNEDQVKINLSLKQAEVVAERKASERNQINSEKENNEHTWKGYASSLYSYFCCCNPFRAQPIDESKLDDKYFIL